jgi:GHMP kinases N terminal domain
VRIGPAPETNDLALQLHRAACRRMVHDFLGANAPALRVTTYSDAPPGSGVGSSSALVVAMMKAFTEYLRLPLSEYEIAQLAYEIERLDCGLAGGKQEQYAAAFGGFNFMEFGPRDRVVVSPLRLRRDYVDDLEAHLLLLYGQVTRIRGDHRPADQGRSRQRSGCSRGDARAQAGGAGNEGSPAARARSQGAADPGRFLGSEETPRAEGVELLDRGSGPDCDGRRCNGFEGLRCRRRWVHDRGSGTPCRYRVFRALERLGGWVFAFSFVDQGVQSWSTESASRDRDLGSASPANARGQDPEALRTGT